ncbi:hypothetical protein Tco_0877920 [Tanacetum coccineum]|uniref:Uncharacterized protein n=1 Tax=Tanacetum coccineum TaxID=301880 RepID=A0ABQ5C1R6_9ASTR
MSDSEDSTVTYTVVSSPFVDLPDIGSPGVDGLPVMPEDPYAYVVAAFQASPSPDYVPGPKYPPSLELVPEPVYPEFMPLEDEILPAEEQPLPAAVSPTADSPGDEEEEEHPDPTDSIAVALPSVDQAPSTEETEPFETDESAATPPPHPAYRVTARISIRDETPISLPPREEIPSPPLPVSSPVHVLSPSPPTSPIRPLGYQAAMIRLRAEAASTSHSLPLPSPIIPSHTRPDAPPLGTPPLHLLSADHRADRPESSSAAAARPTGGLRADYGFVATIDREIMQDLERDVGYGITDTWDEMLVDMPGALATDDTKMGRRMTEFTTRVRQDTDKIYTSDVARAKVMSLRTQVVAQQAVITKLQEADRRRQAVITKMLAADRRRQKQFIEALKLLKRLQTQMTMFERQQGPAKGPTQPDAPEEAGSSS